MPRSSDNLFAEFPPVSTEAWMDKIREDLGEDGYERLVTRPIEGFEVAPFYRTEDRDALDHASPLPVSPGWQLCQHVTASNLEAARNQIRQALDGGVEGLGIQIQVQDEQLTGPPVHTPEALQHLLDDIPLDACAWHLGTGAAALPLLAMLLNEAARREVDPSALRGTAAHDPLGHCARTGRLDPDAAFQETAALLDEHGSTLPNLRLLAIDVTPYHEAGAHAAQELALAIATLSEYLARLTDQGCSLDAVLDEIHLRVPVGRRYFMNIAKLRALRLLYQQVAHAFLKEIRNPKSEIRNCPVQAFTARRSQTLYDPASNLLRHTTEAAAAAAGGADVITVRPHTAPSATSDDFADRLARNIQHVLREEAHLGDVADPGAGAYHVEVLTDKLARHAWSLFQEIEKQGGLLKALHEETVHDQLDETRSQRAEAVHGGRHPFVGTTRYPDPSERREEQGEHPDAMPLQTTGRGTVDPTAPLASRREALREGAALGDLLAAGVNADRLARPLPRSCETEPFEQMRLRTERYAETHGGPPAVFLLPLGDPTMRSARADFARNFFGASGFSIADAGPFETPEAGIDAALDAEADLVVLCSTDDAYADFVPAAREALDARDSDALLIVAGTPQDELRDIADGFTHRHLDRLEALRAYQERLGIA